MSKTHVIDGKTFVEVERKAKVGEKVIIVKAWDSGGMYANGSIITAEKIDDRGIYSEQVCTGEEGSNCGGFIADREYRVLKPVDQAPKSTEDLIANLVRRVAALESQLRDTQNNVERQGVEISANDHAIDELSHRLNHVEADVELNEEDIRKIGAGVQAQQSGAKLLAEAFEALAKYERSVGR
jgi:peptidoglycan hydrolase CwlO-like protein